MARNKASRKIIKKKKSDQYESDKVEKIVNFGLLDIDTLKRYKKHFKLRARHNKGELLTAISKHFETLMINDYEILDAFIMNLKVKRNTIA